MQWTIEQLHNWEELRPYVDTALLPLYLYQPSLGIPAHAERMTYLLNVAAAVEQRLKGRILLFPLLYQIGDAGRELMLPEGFRHYILLQFSGHLVKGILPEGEGRIHSFPIGDEDLASPLRFDVTVDVLYKEVLKVWENQ
ncbi:DUF2487 family protein [Brevibacillus sp. SYP-B805]|uniref:DUF2487 family protein n=1 Tax=Brevibacillus sp. SYP-B805 TaxID=1578199 RepID=UPI0013EAFED2|nr:DUF2487 family protein [Brevibacillus sp. SYP-B805]NGQ94550.1 DUF2487 family protein [Brevibacillus sp. SYP-B805]